MAARAATIFTAVYFAPWPVALRKGGSGMRQVDADADLRARQAAYRQTTLGELQVGDTFETGLTREGAKVVGRHPEGWVLIHWGFGSGESYKPPDTPVVAHVPSRADLFDEHCERMRRLMIEHPRQFRF